MSKGIIVMDIPKLDCRECQCFREQFPSCGAVGKYIDPIVGKKPNWCPIKPIPDRKSEDFGQTIIAAARGEGWNECLDEILKED